MPVFRSDQLPVETSSDGQTRTIWLSEPGALTQFGATVQTLEPGATSALSHWHSDEDELIYVLSGELVVHEGDKRIVSGPGDVATFKAGAPVGHHLENRGDTACSYLVVGTRAATDIITYPEDDRVCVRVRSLTNDVWQTLNGDPSTSPY
jgi:uncharacterized cupin superfamily protein